MGVDYKAPLPQKIKTFNKRFTSAEGTTDVTLITGDALKGWVVEAIHVVSTDGSANTITFKATVGAVTTRFGTVPLAALQGSDGVTNALNALENVIEGWNGRYPILEEDVTFKAALGTALTGGENVDVTIEAWAYDTTAT